MLLMSRHDGRVGEMQTLSALQPYACEVQQIHIAVCALRGHDAHKMFCNVYRFYCSSLHLASSLSQVSWSTSQRSPIRTPSLRTLTLLLRSAVEDDTILAQALESYKAECTNASTAGVTNNNNNTNKGDCNDNSNANVIDNCPHASMRLLFHKLS